MRRHRLLSFLSAVLLALPLSAGQILDLGAFHGSEVPARDGDNWLGLFCHEDVCSVAPARVRVEPFRDMSDKEHEATGRSVSIAGPSDELVCLFKNVPGVEAGAVLTVPERDIVDDREHAKLTFDGIAYELRRSMPETFAKPARLLLRGEGEFQTIATEAKLDEGGPVWCIQWAGDLDHDGRLDFILSCDVFNSRGLQLFLSGTAREGELVRMAASIFHVGC
jgi:hypothetical protein